MRELVKVGQDAVPAIQRHDESSRANPRATCSGCHSGFDSSSAKQNVYLPAFPGRAIDAAWYAATRYHDKLQRPPNVALARLPCPNALPPLFIPMRRETGPLTITTGLEK